MSGASRGAWAVSMGVLAVGWGVVVLALGSLLPASSVSAPPRASRPQHRSVRAYPLLTVKKLPCTNESVTLDLLVALDTTWSVDDDWVDFVVQATLSVTEHAKALIMPVFAHFSFSSPRYGRTGYVHELHAALLEPPVGGEVVVGLEQAIDRAGDLIVQPGQVRLACG